MARHSSAAILVATAAAVLSAQSGKQVIGPNPNLPFSAAVKAGGFIYTAGVVSTQGGDIRAQTRWCLEDLDRTLKSAGSSLRNAAAVNVYLKRASDFAAMNEVYRTFFPADPPARTTIVADLVVPDGLIEISVVAVPDGGERVVIHPPDWAKSPNPYSYGIKSGDTLFLSGMLSRSGKDNAIVEGDMAVQVKTALDNAGAVLKAGGYTFGDVVSVRNFITDTKNFQAMNKLYQTYFPKDPPARATVVAPLTGPQYLYETTMIAVRGSREAVTTPGPDGTPGKPSPNLSSAIKAGNRLFVSGILGNTADNKGDAGAQTREILARVERTLKAAGFGWGDVVDGTVFLTDLTNYAAMNSGYRTVFGKEFPARATVRTGLVAPDGLVEIMFTAVK